MRVAFIGKMMSGKTTSADYLVRNYGFTRLAFADPVKSIAAQMLNTLSMNIHQWEFATHPDNMWDYERIQREKGNPAVRKLLQLVGTELGRELVGYPNVWVDMLIQQIDEYEHVVVDDCRFPNEAEALEDNNFKLIRVMRPEQDRLALIESKYENPEAILSHPSETSLDDLKPHDVIHASDLPSLYVQLDRLVQRSQ